MKRLIILVALVAIIVTSILYGVYSARAGSVIVTGNISTGSGGVAHYNTVNADHINLGGASLLIPAYGEIYATSAKIIEIAVANTPYLYNGVTTSGETLGFTNNGLGRLTYTDITSNRICLLNTALTVSVDAADVPAVVRCYIYKNGVVDPASLVGDYFVAGDVVEALPIVCLIKLLNQGDYIELYFESDKNNVTVTVATMTLIATTVD